MAIVGTPTPGNDRITGDGANNFINALGGDDTVNGGAGNDTLLGSFGNDILTGGLGNDSLNGGSGIGGSGIDTLIEAGDVNFTLTNTSLSASGGLGFDTLSSIDSAILVGGVSRNSINASGFTVGSVTANGQGGDDFLQGGSRNDSIFGGVGNDDLRGNGGNDRIDGGDGNDSFFDDILSGQDTLIGGNGVDQIFFSNSGRNRPATFILTNTSLTTADAINFQADTLLNIEKVSFSAFSDNQTADNQGDFFSAASFTLGTVSLSGGTERDTLIGGAGSDSISGSSGSDDLVGQGGNDIITGGSDNDRLRGDDSNDTLTGGSGFDILFGGNGNDLLRGAAAADDVDGFNGESGNDTLIGSANSFDFFNGGAGDDVLTGGGGQNNFFDFNSGRAFATADLGIDTITDFSPVGNSDVIRLADKTFTAFPGSVGFSGEGELKSSDFARVTSDAVAGSSSAKIVYNSVNGKLFYNPNTTVAGFGSGGQFAVLTGSPDNLSASDFFVNVV